MLDIISILFVLFGLGFLLASIKPTYSICKDIEHKGWCALFVLILAFILGYVFFLIVLILNPVSIVELGLSAILAGGGAFVVIIIQLSLHSITTIKNDAAMRYFESRHDALTKLPNRLCFTEQLAKAITVSKPFAVVMVDLNRFKEVNDTLGHAVGDKLLVQIGQRLQNSLEEPNILSRFGGDEFALILHDVDEETCLHETKKLMDSLEDSFVIEENLLVIDMSIGIALFPNDGINGDVLLKNADIAMYLAKQNKQHFVLYDSTKDTLSPKRLNIISKIQNALNHDEFELYFQPIVDPKNLTLRGFESLIRWPQPDGSMISPGEFIPLIEQSRFIGKVTRWVIRHSIQRIHAWNQGKLRLNISVNLSATDILDKELVPYIKKCLETHPVSPDLLCFEITESAIMLDVDRAKHVIDDLFSMGITIALDDFGTGYSSLSLLRELPAQIIKIDQSFVMQITTNTGDYAIVKSMVELCHRLGKKVVAEGVESLEVLEKLNAVGCDFVQGYYCSKPLSYDDASSWLSLYKERGNKVTELGYKPHFI
ncbi:bifunctional diguanylate cyclase/phosphodiesterase [Paraglaciecola sp.]|uniref:putative bifunctional diguanylate cyclase/phosphodiesterase n=1 Tax=Paraglaciecola sp. TaxID=1920173 RepID=UPI0032637652